MESLNIVEIQSVVAENSSGPDLIQGCNAKTLFIQRLHAGDMSIYLVFKMTVPKFPLSFVEIKSVVAENFRTDRQVSDYLLPLCGAYKWYMSYSI